MNRWLVGSLWGVALCGCGRESARDPGLAAREILAAERPFLPRLAGQVTHHGCALAPPRPAVATCTEEARAAVDVPSLLCTGFTLSRAEVLRLERAGGPQARAILLARPGANPTAGFEALERAAAAAPEDAEQWIDLGAATLVAAGETDRPELLVQAIETTARAAELAPGRPEAHFNRALALSSFHLETPAKAAWEEFLRLEPAGPWAEEARSQLAALSRKSPLRWGKAEQEVLRKTAVTSEPGRLRELIAPVRQQAREWVERELLAEWAAAVAAHDRGRASAILSAARAIAEALTALTGDTLLRDAVAALAGAEPGAPATEQLARGHDLLAQGYGKIYGWMPEQALPPLDEAAGLLRSAGSPFSAWARFYHALATYYANRSRDAERQLAALAADVEGKSYPALQGRIAWIRGLAVSSLEELQPAADHYARAMGIFCALGEVENRAAAQSLYASALSRLGKSDHAWNQAYAAFERRPEILNPVRDHALLEDAVFGALREGLHLAARAISDEHVYTTERTGNAQLLHLARLRSAAVFAALRKPLRAEEELRLATLALEELPSPALRQRGDADSSLAQGRTLIRSDPHAALDLLSAAVRGFAEQDFVQRLPETYHARAQAHLALGRPIDAERDLEREIRLLDLGRQGVVSFPDRAAFAGLTRAAFDAMVDLQVHQHGSLAKAFAVSEARRAALEPSGSLASRRNPDPATGAAANTVSLEVAQERLPAGTGLLVVTVLPDSTLIWVIRRDAVATAEIAVPLSKLRGHAESFRKAVLSGQRVGWQKTGAELSQWLLRPVAEGLAGLHQLVIIPDRFLYEIPFEALPHPRSGLLLVEDVATLYAPSATLYERLTRSATARARPGSPELLALAGWNDGHGRLPALPAAERETKAVAALYTGARAFSGDALDPEQPLASLHGVEIFHFAGHATSQGTFESDAALVLADTARGQVRVSAAELGAAAPRLRLAVLGACSTARADGARGEPLSRLVEPLLAAGVPAVLGSLWAVEDSAAEALLLAFHRHMASGRDPAGALRAAKLALLRTAEPHDWAGWVLVGASPGTGQ